MQHIIYLHGFLSSPSSLKAQQTQQYLRKHYPSVNLHCPQLSGNIDKTLQQVESLVKTIPPTQRCFIGSSMGGFLANYAVEKFGGRAALINPAIKPHDLLQDYLGMHTNPYSGERFHITRKHLITLHRCYQKALSDPLKYMVLLQTGDEVLDYRLAAAKYSDSHLIVEEGGDHSFIDYDKWLAKIINFLRH